MTPAPLPRWSALSAEIGKAREATPPTANSIQNELIRQLKRLAGLGRCSKNVEGWLHSHRAKGGLTIELKASSDAKDNWERPALGLKNLHHLQDAAVLSFFVTLSERAPKGIRQYAVGLEGKTRSDGVAWYARIDLTEKPEGEGHCGHPLLHCHVGHSADEPHPLDAAPAEAATTEAAKAKTRIFSPRVPLPWLEPWEALEWLLATVDPDLEPPKL